MRKEVVGEVNIRRLGEDSFLVKIHRVNKYGAYVGTTEYELDGVGTVTAVVSHALGDVDDQT